MVVKFSRRVKSFDSIVIEVELSSGEVQRLLISEFLPYKGDREPNMRIPPQQVMPVAVANSRKYKV